MSVPMNPVHLMYKTYKNIFPVVNELLSYWKKRAESIPNEELRKQAIASIETKTFHCEGGSILSLLAQSKYKEVVKFIVAYQTISDYLDNLCDRSTSLNPDDFRALHESMIDSLTIGNSVNKNYYRFREEQDDGGYLQELVLTCQSILATIPNYPYIKEQLIELCQYYSDLQVYKHVIQHERVPRLKDWFELHKESVPPMNWYEFSAASGSTLGIFCLVSYACRNDFKQEYSYLIKECYFPYIQGLHILLDYFIDQEEDRKGGDLNFCFYYKDEGEMFDRLVHFIREAENCTNKLPHSKFHKLISDGLLGIYLSDEKTRQSKDIHTFTKKLIRKKGKKSFFFYINGRIYRKLKEKVSR